MEKELLEDVLMSVVSLTAGVYLSGIGDKKFDLPALVAAIEKHEGYKPIIIVVRLVTVKGVEYWATIAPLRQRTWGENWGGCGMKGPVAALRAAGLDPTCQLSEEGWPQLKARLEKFGNAWAASLAGFNAACAAARGES